MLKYPWKLSRQTSVMKITIQQMALQALKKTATFQTRRNTAERTCNQSVMITVNLVSMLTFDLMLIFPAHPGLRVHENQFHSSLTESDPDVLNTKSLVNPEPHSTSSTGCFCVFGCVCPECVRPPRASFIQQP